MSLLRTLIQSFLDYINNPPPPPTTMAEAQAFQATALAQKNNYLAVFTELQNVGDAVGTGFSGTSDDIPEGTVHLFLTASERNEISSNNELAIAYAVAL